MNKTNIESSAENTKFLHLISLGCTKNLVDSEVMLGVLKDYEITDEISKADIIIINTCGFIEAAKSESISVILNAISMRKKSALVVAAGCLSARYHKELKEQIKELDIICGVGEYNKIDELIKTRKNELNKSDNLDSIKSKNTIDIESKSRAKIAPLVLAQNNVFLLDENTPRKVSQSRIHAYIKLSEGCNQKCAFCAIPSFKGKLHSRTLNSALKEVANLATQGFCDFSFISQDSSSFMRDLGIKDGLIPLISALDELADSMQNKNYIESKSQNAEILAQIKSARILYLYPKSTSHKLISAIEKSKIVQNYFDIPLQHKSAKVLKTMRRDGEFLELIAHARELENSFIRTSFIIGHPGEDEAAFNELCEFLEEFDFDRVNLFAFSSEEGTIAQNLEQIPRKIINSRLKILEKIWHKKYLANLQKQVGKELCAIIEGASSEGDFFYKARPIIWANEIDGEILINEIAQDIESNLKNNSKQNLILPSGYYKIKINELAGENLLASVKEQM